MSLNLFCVFLTILSLLSINSIDVSIFSPFFTKLGYALTNVLYNEATPIGILSPNFVLQMETPLQQSFENRVALTTSIIAVALSLSTIYSNAIHDDLLLSQGHANNAWSYFQSKSIKQNVYEVILEELLLDVDNDLFSQAHRQRIRGRINRFQEEISRYNLEKATIKQQAETYQTEAEKADARGVQLDLAEAFYQIAIILSAICLIAKSRWLWRISIVLGLVGACCSAYAWLM